MTLLTHFIDPQIYKYSDFRHINVLMLVCQQVKVTLIVVSPGQPLTRYSCEGLAWRNYFDRTFCPFKLSTHTHTHTHTVSTHTHTILICH